MGLHCGLDDLAGQFKLAGQSSYCFECYIHAASVTAPDSSKIAFKSCILFGFSFSR